MGNKWKKILIGQNVYKLQMNDMIEVIILFPSKQIKWSCSVIASDNW